MRAGGGLEPGMNSDWREIPGPVPVPPNGNLAAIAEAGGLHTFQLALHEKYGPVARFELPGTSVVSVADPELLSRTSRINERPDELFEFLSPLFEAGNLQTIPEREHVPWRRLLLSALGSHRSHEAHFSAFTRLTLELADRWAGEREVSLQEELSDLSLRIICEFALGSADGAAERIGPAFRELIAEYLARQFGLPSAIPEAERATRAEEALARVRGAITRTLESQSRSGGLVGMLAESGWSPARIRDTAVAVLLAGYHTSGVAVSWALHLLAGHPEITRRLREELDRVLGDRPAPTYRELRSLDYLERVVKEAMRRYPPGPYAARELTEDLVLGDHLVPAGTTLMYPIWAIHLNPVHWPDPERFDPERFTAKAAEGRPKFAYLPFGFGPRSCEGAALAMVEVKLMLAILVKHFEFASVPGHRVTPVERFVLWARDDIRLNLTPRDR
ncbi:cytochrome P450 [Amycolatopsis sp. PS_44_ISF1]|uniref:cytochrome P450 n=1 Tax=Amycolatopsis sp. PS_44_ISF1 TaxID=2974917 RepID=UPI0028DFA70C|nr:cytochrome P450 [Amycolatopsis sp. PS_44_ISF1]MDT8912052.1 cytochrome P450 [Amycolatopsis sp. PS_44_ISF1]